MNKGTVVSAGVVVGVATFVLGVIIGSGMENTATIEVPGETVTETVEVPGETVTETVTEKVVPGACLTAISEAETLGTTTARIAPITIGYLRLIEEAFQVGAAGGVGIDSVLAELKDLESRTTELNKSVEVVVGKFNIAKTVCRQAAERAE